MEKKLPVWKVLNCYIWHDGPLEFTATLVGDPNPDVFYFREAGGTPNERLYVSDTHQYRSTPYYVKEENLDLSEMTY